MFTEPIDAEQRKAQMKQIKKLLQLRDSDIAAMFNYKSRVSYANSSGKKDIETGLIRFYMRTLEIKTKQSSE